MLTRRCLTHVTNKPFWPLARSSASASALQRRHHATASSKKPKLVDLSRELYHRSPAHPFHPPVVITPWDTHQPKQAGNTILRSASYALAMSDHAGTHVDAPKHFDPTPGALSIDQMPLDNFFTEAICLDLSHVELKASISVQEMEDALAKSGQEIREGDTVLLYMAFNRRIPFDNPRWQHDFPGLSLEAVHWLADKGCKIFGVEAISPAPEGEPNFQAHNACGERNITHIEGLDNLEEVVGKGRFRFMGFPLKIRHGSGGPMRAVAMFE
ncbi:Kynurenine formamidase [Pseudocercospora fuligena]|uniref:Kynurenine formamidase n=1 Tax=Pseudocercospora fuligena TaxID=685502 RepID=A0A8H6RFS2_9PEZI|nr:Kynurenine formamidase [Pseudocercospora fuligena]